MIDAREFVEGWNSVGFDDGAWQLAEEVSPTAELSAQMMEPTRIIEKIQAKEVSGSGPYRFDMGSSGLPLLFKFITEESKRSELMFKALSSDIEPSYGYFLRRGEST